MRYVVRIVRNTTVEGPDGLLVSPAEDLPSTFASTALADVAARAELARLSAGGVSARYLILDEDGDGVDDRGRKLG